MVECDVYVLGPEWDDRTATLRIELPKAGTD